MKTNNKKCFFSVLLSAFALMAMTSCSDWTEMESLQLNEPAPNEVNPEAYAKYVENLRQYKADAEHKVVYAWFDNSDKTPSSRAQHVSSLPDSIDVVGLKSPFDLAEFEKKELVGLREKGTKVVYAICYDDIKQVYDEQAAAQQAAEQEGGNTLGLFDDYLKQEVEKQLACADYFDGIVLVFRGKNPKYMKEEDKATYLASQNVFFNTVLNWQANHKDKFLTFQGKPQNVIERDKLALFKHFIVEMQQVTDIEKFSLLMLDCLESGVPTDRFVLAVSAPALNSTDEVSGMMGKEKAMIETAYWLTVSSSDYVKSGILIDNVQNDYYQSNGTYQSVKEVINILNPAPVK